MSRSRQPKAAEESWEALLARSITSLEALSQFMDIDENALREVVTRYPLCINPYYLFQADLARGTSHFWTTPDRGLKIMARIQGHTSGFCLPHFVIDLPGGMGKIPLLPRYVLGESADTLIVRNYLGEKALYPLHLLRKEAPSMKKERSSP